MAFFRLKNRSSQHVWSNKTRCRPPRSVTPLTFRCADFDLLIIAPSDLPRWQRTPPLYQLLAGLGVPKDIVWWTLEEVEEWRGVKSHFVNTALREGKVLYEKPA